MFMSAVSYSVSRVPLFFSFPVLGLFVSSVWCCDILVSRANLPRTIPPTLPCLILVGVWVQIPINPALICPKGDDELTSSALDQSFRVAKQVFI
jgi:hypothetical protein